MNLSQRKQFIGYFRKRLESLDDCYIIFKKAIEDEKQKIMDSAYNGGIKRTDPNLSEALAKLDNLIPSAFRNCMFVATCTLVEDVLLQIGTNTVPDFKDRERKLKSHHHMSTVRRYLNILESQLTIDFAPINNDLQLIDDIVNIRNAITHAWGKIDNCTNPVTLEKICKRRNWVQEEEGYILVGCEAYADATTPVLNLVEHILDSVPVSDN